MLLRVTDENFDDVISAAVSVLKEGGVIAYPTETFYALGAKYDMAPALRRLYELKKRPEDKAMPLIIGDIARLDLLTDSINDTARELFSKFWPGPLTLIFRARNGLEEYVVSEGRVAVRVPGESFGLRLARAAGFPITATSANISNRPPAEEARMVVEYFGDEPDLIIDGGKTSGGLPSTIIDVSGDSTKILRNGAVDAGRLRLSSPSD